jgi:hypothetical protein
MDVNKIKQDILECTSYDELNTLYTFINNFEFRDLMQKLYHEKSKKVRAKNTEYAAKVKQQAESEYPAINAFVKNVVKAGDLLKFKGASRSGIRQVISIDKYDILGHVVDRVKKENGELKVRTSGYTSSNGIDKIIGFYSEEDGGFISRKIIVERGSKLL